MVSCHGKFPWEMANQLCMNILKTILQIWLIVTLANFKIHRTCPNCYQYLSTPMAIKDRIVQDCSISIANALDILQSCTKPSICPMCFCQITWTNQAAMGRPYLPWICDGNTRSNQSRQLGSPREWVWSHTMVAWTTLARKMWWANYQ